MISVNFRRNANYYSESIAFRHLFSRNSCPRWNKNEHGLFAKLQVVDNDDDNDDGVACANEGPVTTVNQFSRSYCSLRPDATDFEFSRKKFNAILFLTVMGMCMYV